MRSAQFGDLEKAVVDEVKTYIKAAARNHHGYPEFWIASLGRSRFA
ncbi:MAG: hypothetical protein AB7L90_02150 [Hyphomicrobiaceae bacterium]